MKSLHVVIFLMMALFTKVNAQSFAFIDSDYMLNSIPEYAESKAKLDKLAETWTKDIEDRFNVIKTQKENFNKEEILLPAEEKAKRKSEIEKLEKSLDFLKANEITNEEISVLFRLPTETGEKFNNFVREEKLNSSISEKTKAVFISSKVPKTILDKKIKFNCGN